MERVYFVDGKQTEWGQLIKMAQEIGYDEPYGVYSTSGAARVLRKHGHTVEQKEIESPAATGAEEAR